MKRPTVAVLYLCTGAYQVFWKDFYPNFKELFCRRQTKRSLSLRMHPR